MDSPTVNSPRGQTNNNQKFPEYLYVDTAFGSPGNRNRVKNIKQLEIPNDGRDCYVSMFRFGDEYKQLCDKTGSVRGASNLPCYCDFLWFDIDDETDLHNALMNARQLVISIEKKASDISDHLSIWFSGNKGFHIGVPACLFGFEPSQDLPKICKEIAMTFATSTEIDKAIYEHNRLWRVPNTINSKSGLYKIPLTHEQLATWSIDKIKKEAATPEGNPVLAAQFTEAPHLGLQSIYNTVKNTFIQKKNSAQPQKYGDNSQALDKPCLKEILKGVKKGIRNEAAIRR